VWWADVADTCSCIGTPTALVADVQSTCCETGSYTQCANIALYTMAHYTRLDESDRCQYHTKGGFWYVYRVQTAVETALTLISWRLRIAFIDDTEQRTHHWSSRCANETSWQLTSIVVGMRLTVPDTAHLLSTIITHKILFAMNIYYIL